jgi:nucleotide-binding universal stress UspA family protein
MNLRRILVPVDFSESITKALQYAEALAREYRAAVTLLHVIRPDGSHHRRNISKERLIEEMREAGEGKLRKLADELWSDEVATDAVVATGKPYLQIIREAKEMASDLIVMGGHGPVGSWGLFRRNTLAKVVRHAPCPVLIVHPFQQGSIRDTSRQRIP